ncbi:protein tilB homolog isoform X2 [Crotalus tigris]|uniref:protein tilB homolog isoform X2 n=1 Tax=Crotalus tigris TaxID=88082 RepID=UPI00192F3D96|nr:protein tilB homolog isoform X2 [Crotalus tigris]
MCVFTEELIRQRAEHNNCELFSLEEVSLHQQNIEKIEHLDKWCRNLKILYLQNNLISKIENVSRLKKLEYLNLALNNIEKFENLEGCEDLQKLDLTANFIGELSSVKILKNNIHLEELYLVGNPCTDFEGYRQFVVATLHQLRFLDCKEITRSERIQAVQNYPALERKIQEQEQNYLLKREEEKKEAERWMLEKQKERKEKKKKKGQYPGFDKQSCADIKTPTYYSVEGAENHRNSEEGDEFRKLILEDDDEDRDFWDEPVPHTPEARLEIHQYLEEKRKERENKEQGNKEKPLRTLITPEGRVLNVNEAKLPFSLEEDDKKNRFILDLAVYRHLDISFLNVDVQPTYVRVMVKGKAFQLVLPEEVKPDSSVAERSQTTGHLVISMPKVKDVIITSQKASISEKTFDPRKLQRNLRRHEGLEKLEVDPTKYSFPDVTNIVHKKGRMGQGPLRLQQPKVVDTENLSFEDNLEVPPLI